jgi:glyoxylase-like metal-dependent hydrolase (beta-lactamase superfamily II)
MKRPAEGRVHERITAIADVVYPAYIVRGQKRSVMIEAGLNLLGPCYLEAIEDLFGKTGWLDYLFLSHSHYDHVGSADYLKRHLPGLQIGAHERVAGLMRKPSVLERLNRLSLSHVEIPQYNPGGEDLTLHPFDIDLPLGQGDEFDLGGLTCHVCETPGHTRDSLAYFIPEIGALFPGDACGVLRTGPDSPLQVEFVASYRDYVHSLELLIALEPRIICLAHNWVLTDDDAAEFLEHSLAETFRYRELIESYLDAANGDVERAIRDMARAEYEGKGTILPPPAAYMTNLAAQVKHIAACRSHGGKTATHEPQDGSGSGHEGRSPVA